MSSTITDLRPVVDALAGAIVITDSAHRIVHVNRAAEALLGWSALELGGRPAAEILQPVDGSGPARGRVTARRRDRRALDLDLSVAPVADLFLLALSGEHNVTERESAQDILRIVDSVIAAAPVAIGFVDRELRFVRGNNALAAISGRKATDLIGRRIEEALPDIAAAILPYYRRILETGEPSQQELSRPLSGSSGPTRHWLLTRYPVHDARGEIQGIGIIGVDITDRKRAEQERVELLERELHARVDAEHARREVEAERVRLRTLVMRAPTIIAVLRGPEHVVELANPLHRRLAPPKQPVLGRRFRDVFPELADQGIVDILDQAYGSGEPFAARELPLRLLDEAETSRERFFDAVVLPLRTAAGIVEGLMVHAADITEQVLARKRAEALAQARQRAEQELRRSEDRLRLAIESTGLGTWDFDPATRTLELDARTRSLLGIPLSGRCDAETALAAVHPDDRTALSRTLRRTLVSRDGAAFKIELRVIALADEAHRWIEAHGLPHRGDDGRVRLVGTILDISDRRRAADEQRFLVDAATALSESLDLETTLRKILHLAIPRVADVAAVQFTESDGTVRTVFAHPDPEEERKVTEAARDRTDTDEAPLLSRRAMVEGVTELIEEMTPEMIARLQRVYPNSAKTIGDWGLRSAMIMPLRSRGRAIIGAMSFVSTRTSGRRYGPADLAFAEEFSARCALAIENARLFAEAQEAIRARDEFLSIASHELRTPLTPLQLQVSSLERRVHDVAKEEQEAWVADRLTAIHRQADRLTRLVNELLDISRIVGGRLRLDLEPVDLVAVVRESIAELEAEGALARAMVELRLDVPQTLIGRWDRMRLEQVVGNLFSNAIKYGPGKPVTVSARAAGASAILTVADQGIGIAPEDQDRIFGRFERAVSVRHYGGLGLGLYIVRQVVEALGGSIGVRSGIGEGAEFTVVLPLAGPPEHAIRREERAAAPLPS